MSYELKEYRILGYTTDFNVCDCCGKEDLKGTIAILAVNYDVVLHFGTTCAAKADKYDSIDAARKAKREINSIVKEFADMEKCAAGWATKYSKELRLNLALTYDNCHENKEYFAFWKAAKEAKYAEFVESRSRRESEKIRLAGRTHEQVEAEESARQLSWAKWRERRELNVA